MRGLPAVAILVALATGCGRLGFDAGAGADANADASVPPNLALSLSSGYSHTCAVTFGTLSCWGDNAGGQLGLGDMVARNAAAVVAPDRSWQQVTGGQLHTCAIASTEELYCWGANMQGELGVGDLSPRLTPTLVPLPAAVRSVEAGFGTTCAVLVDDSLWCWGDNAEGQLALDDAVGSPDMSSPVRIGITDRWRDAACGQGHMLAVSMSSALWGSGRNIAYELGLGAGSPGQRRMLTAIAPGPWIEVTAGQNSSCAVDDTMRLFCWGANSMGQLGTGDMAVRDLPFQIAAAESWRDVDLDTFTTCAITASGSMSCWGRNVEGQLGVGDNADRMVPTASGTFTDWIAIGAGRFHTCAMREDGSVWCTGNNASGELGTKDNNRRKEDPRRDALIRHGWGSTR